MSSDIICLFIPSYTQQVFITCPSLAKLYAGHRKYDGEKKRSNENISKSEPSLTSRSLELTTGDIYESKISTLESHRSRRVWTPGVCCVVMGGGSVEVSEGPDV